MRTRLTFLFLTGAAICTVVIAAQQPAPADQPLGPPVTFRAEVNYVEVDASVTDAKGNLVSDLTQNDFELLEDGKPQRITTFAHVNIPVSRDDQPLFASAPIERDVQTNDRVDGRVYLIVLDSLHTSPLNALRVKAAAKTFIERRFGANDIAAIAHTSGRSDFGQDFTNNRRLLLASIDKFMGDKLDSETLAKAGAYANGGGAVDGNPSLRARNPVNSTQLSIMDPDEMQRADHARTMLRHLRKLSDFMAGIRGRRKALILISQGLGYDLADPFSSTQTSMIIDDVKDAIGAATRANVSIYAIDPGGLNSGTSDAIELDSFPDDRSLGASLSSMLSEQKLAQDSLRELSDETGGFAAVNRNDFKDIFERVVRDNSTYYVLGYYPTNDKRDGRFRRITLRVKRSGLHVRSRKGYEAPRGKVPEPKASDPNITQALRDAMGSPIPMAGIPMRVFAAAFKGTAPNASVAVSVEVQTADFKYDEKNGTFTDTLTLSFTPIEQNGTLKPGKRTKATLAFKPDTHRAASANGIRMLSALDLPPGRYQIRIAAAESGADRSGTVLYDLDVPDFLKAPLSMSGVAVTSESAARMVTIGSEGLIAPLMPGPTSATREFARGDTVALFAEVYENRPNAVAHKLDLSTTMRAADGRSVFETKEERSSTELQAGRGGYGYLAQIPLKDVAPGTYVVHVQARSRTTSDAGIGRDIQISVK